jgi:hypothetical protein
MRQRFNHLASLLASGASSVSRLFDAHQATGCLVALCSPQCLPPFRHGPLLRLLLVLLDNDGGKMRDLNSYELAQCAAAAAAMQDALRRQQQQQQQQQQEQWLKLSATRQLSLEGFATESSDALQTSNAFQGSSSSSGALALLDPLQQLWQLLLDAITPQLATFSVDSLALTALSLAAAGRNSKELTLGIVNAALARPQKWGESPVAVSRMLKALVLTDTQHKVGGRVGGWVGGWEGGRVGG